MMLRSQADRAPFRGAVAVVTGAGSGIGRSLALQLHRQGARLAISDINSEWLASTGALLAAAATESVVRTDQLDVTDRAAVLAYADSVAAEFGVVNLVVNNAGVSHGGDVLGMSFADLERVMNVDFWGVANGTKAFLPHLIASGDGYLVNISSLFGLVAVPAQSAYVAAKYAVRGFTESLRMEMVAAGHPVRVTCVHPGGVRTGIARNGTVNAGTERAGRSDFFDRKLARTSADSAAATILDGAAHGRPRVLVGYDAHLVNFVAALSHRGYQRLVASGFRRMR
jgi:NAD(P)-dependent dehydrogenase (short-subunit alcohol dehydrogenase family)